MLGSWSSLLLLLSTQLLVPAFANHDQVKFSPAAAKRQAQDAEGKAQYEALHSQYLTNLRNTLEPGGQCTWDNMIVRREWGDMPRQAQLDYISALKCLKQLPPQDDRNKYPGLDSRYDDLSIAHALNAHSVHRSPALAIWHRLLVHTLETLLRDECDYQHGLPYWHWSKYLGTDPNSWPMFDGSDTSLSGNGTQTGPQCACVMEGPFADWVVTLGPLPNTWGCTPNPQSDGFGKNPRCIERTFDLTMLDTLGYDSFVYTATAPDVNTFARVLELDQPCLHNYPHLFVGAAEKEVSFSAQDPWFWHHHSTVELLFDMWQSFDYDVRTTTLADPAIFDKIRESPGWGPTPRVNLDTELYLSSIFDNVTIRDVMWPNRGKYCWRYE